MHEHRVRRHRTPNRARDPHHSTSDPATPERHLNRLDTHQHIITPLQPTSIEKRFPDPESNGAIVIPHAMENSPTYLAALHFCIQKYGVPPAPSPAG